MVFSLTFPDRYAWVLLAGVGAGWLTFWQSALVIKHRKAANVSYPQLYAEKTEALASQDAMKFNCAQRAHQNTLEVLPQILFGMLVSGLQYPTITAGLSAVWLFGRVLYTQGYCTGEPKNRNRGFISGIAGLGLLLVTTWTTGEFVCAIL